ncbi:MAG: endonuclease, partial [Phaeobacter gallaeciensis]
MPETTLRLASYNIQKCVGLDLRRQPRRILNVLEDMGARIVLLQEADKRLPPRPAALPHFVLNEAGWQDVDLGG